MHHRLLGHLLVSLLPALTCAADDKLGWADKPAAEERSVQTDRGWMVPYDVMVPGTDVKLQMVPIPGGTFIMGSPASSGKEDERPQIQVQVAPFWMGQYEITWSQYKPFMALYEPMKQFESKQLRKVTDANRVDAITIPTKLYDPTFTFEKGENPRQPAVTMTQYAAKQYTKWLSLTTGHAYRLPSEAEWEYACRAGTQTAFSFGDDPEKLPEYGWFFDNANESTHPVAQKKPNAWGLYDMHGNAAEWVLDQYFATGYKAPPSQPAKAADLIAWPTVLYPRAVRGGHWDSDPEDCRCASRLPSHDDDWKSNDPNLPLSPWWYTSDPARGVGFRLVRQIEPLTLAQRERLWEPDVDAIRDAVADRLKEGRGVLGVVDPALPEAVKSLQ
jgi:sulfatase modifying factor 1